MMKDIDIARLKELAERATPGEWQVDADASHIRIVTADDACVYPFWLSPTPNKEANAAYIAAASPDVVLALIEEVERLRAREADYRQYLAGIRQGLELREADEKENEKELEKALDEVERLKKLSGLWKHDYENLARSGSQSPMEAFMDTTTPRLTTVNQADAARMLGVKAKTLEAWRWTGRGPAFVKVGRLVRYRLSDLEKYLDRQTVEEECKN